jgi:hypothetical protein
MASPVTNPEHCGLGVTLHTLAHTLPGLLPPVAAPENCGLRGTLDAHSHTQREWLPLVTTLDQPPIYY